MTDHPFTRPKMSPALERWADFPGTRQRVGVRLSRPSHISVPTIVQVDETQQTQQGTDVGSPGEPHKHVHNDDGPETSA